jgi:hypothetical protein
MFFRPHTAGMIYIVVIILRAVPCAMNVSTSFEQAAGHVLERSGFAMFATTGPAKIELLTIQWESRYNHIVNVQKRL